MWRMRDDFIRLRVHGVGSSDAESTKCVRECGCEEGGCWWQGEPSYLFNQIIHRIFKRCVIIH